MVRPSRLFTQGVENPAGVQAAPLAVTHYEASNVGLDDYHVVKDSSCHTQIASLLPHLPSAVQLVLITRVDPALPLARMRAVGEMIEVRARSCASGPRKRQQAGLLAWSLAYPASAGHRSRPSARDGKGAHAVMARRGRFPARVRIPSVRHHQVARESFNDPDPAFVAPPG